MPAREHDISFSSSEDEEKFYEACKTVAKAFRRRDRAGMSPLVVTSFKLTSEELVQLRRVATMWGWTPSAFCRAVISSVCKEAANAG